MLERFYLKDMLSFQEAELVFKKGLIVFSGPSGSGKSILMEAILAALGLKEAKAALGELEVSWRFDEERYGILNDEPNILRHVKKEKVRYFINAQSLSKRSVSELSTHHLKHLSLRDYSDFDNSNLLRLLDHFCAKSDTDFEALGVAYSKHYSAYNSAKRELEQIEEEERRIVELMEFARYEIAKIDEVNPQMDEDEALMEIKKSLSKREKIEHSITAAQSIFDTESHVIEALNLLEVDVTFFDDAMNELRAHLDAGFERMSELDDVDIESVLDRIEALSELKRRYGSIEAALEHRETKRKELEHYEQIEIAKSDLMQRVEALHVSLMQEASAISKTRKQTRPLFEVRLNHYLNALYLRNGSLNLAPCEADSTGIDTARIELEGTDMSNLSSGEFNRLRLALLAVWSEFMQSDGGVLMLDEIDANLSGEESMSVARVLKTLSRVYQIFVISHQPQLTSMGMQHFFVSKDTRSRVRELDATERVEEIARMVSGEAITQEARHFAKELLESAQCVS